MAVFKKLVIPNGNKDITENGDVDISGYASVNVNVQPELQSKTTTPTTSEQEIIADESYYGLSKVIVNPIPNEYIVPSGSIEITENGTYDVTDYVSANVNIAGVIEVPQVSNLAINKEGVLTYDEPDYSGLEKYNPTISYLINVNNNTIETSENTIDVSEYLIVGENNVAITIKVLIKGLAKEKIIKYGVTIHGTSLSTLKAGDTIENIYLNTSLSSAEVDEIFLNALINFGKKVSEVIGEEELPIESFADQVFYIAYLGNEHMVYQWIVNFVGTELSPVIGYVSRIGSSEETTEVYISESFASTGQSEFFGWNPAISNTIAINGISGDLSEIFPIPTEVFNVFLDGIADVISVTPFE